MRIQGLVRFFNQVRAELSDGIAAREAERFRHRVTEVVGYVESECRRYQTTPERLPAPSRAAYRFLKGLDLTNLPLVADGSPAPRSSSLRLQGILTVERHLAHQMWTQLPQLLDQTQAVQELRSDIERHLAHVESMCSRSGVSPGQLQAPSRRVYCWLKFLTDPDNLELHLRALQRAANAVADRHGQRGPQCQLLLLHIQAIWTSRQDRQGLEIKVSEGFLSASEEVWGSLLSCAISGRKRADTRLVDDFYESEDFSEVLIEVEAFAAPTVASTRGRIHSLDESFKRVNRVYFGGTMPRPTIEWNRTLTGRKFGHYRPHRDAVMVSVSLDDDRVPAHVVDFVMYHELLHKKHQSLVVNGRRVFHTAAFRSDERLFDGYADAVRSLNSLAKHGGYVIRESNSKISGVNGGRP